MFSLFSLIFWQKDLPRIRIVFNISTLHVLLYVCTSNEYRNGQNALFYCAKQEENCCLQESACKIRFPPEAR